MNSFGKDVDYVLVKTFDYIVPKCPSLHNPRVSAGERAMRFAGSRSHPPPKNSTLERRSTNNVLYFVH